MSEARRDSNVQARSSAAIGARSAPSDFPSRDRDWYEACLDCLADLERHAARSDELTTALEPWCRLCAEAARVMNGHAPSTGSAQSPLEEDDVDYLNGTLFARCLLRRLNRRFGRRQVLK